MKTTRYLAVWPGLAGLGVAALMSGCVMEPYGEGGAVVVGPPPPPAVEVAVYPDSYWWDGYEYIGIVGGDYYYLGPGNVWITCEPFRVERFREWQRVHPDWHERATVNERYHSVGPGHGQNRDEGRGRGRGRDGR